MVNLVSNDVYLFFLRHFWDCLSGPKVSFTNILDRKLHVDCLLNRSFFLVLSNSFRRLEKLSTNEQICRVDGTFTLSILVVI